ncbi:Aminotransferase [Pseudomonas sp. XWY-1]|uniref:phosphotransferase n=1 Tax=Pseudomonas TaxID=286 RepID=UPI000CDC9431|nr:MULTISPECIES: phosphotransferase [Pseudomonas]AUZ58564.1 Aminotransferase [Pseudomonas sp. XWY-1]MDD2146762.1 phosphotransferase [Pseudomonas putida]UVL87075.1 phosphotransferase [Pseudomonas sichuanensis]HDS1705589.1 phosphotransferase [Pseudomonas putida]
MSNEHKPGDSHASLTTEAGEIGSEQARQIAARYFGVEASAVKRLISERDHNFHLQGTDGAYVLKIAHPAEDRMLANFQSAALLHVEQRDPGLHVQRVIRALDGRSELALEFEGQTRIVRMVSYLEGTLLRHAPVSLEQQFNLGVELARLGVALRDFEHPSADHMLLWDIQHAERLRPMFDVFEPVHRAWVEEALERYVSHAKPVLAGLRRQVVHNDLNSDNALVDPQDPSRVAALLDFGDMVRTALVNDVVVAVAYALGDGEQLLEAPRAFIEGYQSVTPLSDDELAIFHDLLMVRMALRLTLTEWRASRFPENRDYILRNTPRTWTQFEQLRTMPRQRVEQMLFGERGLAASAIEWRA